MNTASTLNLARKWRSQSFDQVVGQELVVRLLKNSLYRDMLMPVYLLAGMRGCGKTSIGRLFAAALNCAQLDTFRKLPQETSLPCWSCISCRAIQKNQHPDFIEIDAASHTGVDNIRNLIDIASFVPALGTKKIYLIDEAHMLSKAAFNALLKILEEPPLSVVFMLATTDSHKVPDTVRSRCFQLFFKPILSAELIKHLASVCKQEQIPYDNAGLELVAQESEGSARDALNLIERVRMSHEAISKETLTRVLGFLDDEKLITLFEVLLHKQPADLLQLCTDYNLASYNTPILLKKLITLIRGAILVKYALPIDNFALFQARIAQNIQSCSAERLINCLDLCYTHEPLFSKTALPYPLFELLLIKLNQCSPDLKKKLVLPEAAQLQPVRQSTHHLSGAVSSGESTRITQVGDKASTASGVAAPEIVDVRWKNFMVKLESIEDHLLNSIFKQAQFLQFVSETNNVELRFGENLKFFKDTIDTSISVWQPLLIQAFGSDVTCVMHFDAPASVKLAATRVQQKTAPEVIVQTREVQPQKNSQAKFTRFPAEQKQKEVTVSISETEKWPKAVLLSKIFPGILTQIKT